MARVDLGPAFDEPSMEERYRHDMISILALTVYLVGGTLLLWALSWGIIWALDWAGVLAVTIFEHGWKIAIPG